MGEEMGKAGGKAREIAFGRGLLRLMEAETPRSDSERTRLSRKTLLCACTLGLRLETGLERMRGLWIRDRSWVGRDLGEEMWFHSDGFGVSVRALSLRREAGLLGQEMSGEGFLDRSGHRWAGRG